MTQKLLNQYEGLPLLPGVRSDFSKPLLHELLDRGKVKTVLELLHSVNLEIKEQDNKFGFIIYTKINGKKRNEA